jgi:Ni/Fe-hydrogenase 1 B-type cytochrome subunit
LSVAENIEIKEVIMSTQREQVFVWSHNLRLFHWINVIAILLLVIIGTIILNSKVLGVTSDGKIILKTMHVIVGYIFAANLLGCPLRVLLYLC